MTYKPINSYGLIGDMHSAALVGLDGSIDWLCFPRFSSPSVFAAILDDGKGGHFALHPAVPYTSEQRYVTDTNVLSTSFMTDTGRVEVQDFMPLTDHRHASYHMVLRVVTGVAGRVEMTCRYKPRLNYAQGVTTLHPRDGGVIAECGDARLALTAPFPLDIDTDKGLASATFSVNEGMQLVFALQWGVGLPPRTADWRERLEHTTAAWRRIANSVSYEGRWRETVRRSVLALHLLVYRPTGALVAAATTSLPEWIGGDRNWDYRFCWIRDAAFVLDVLNRLGHTAETVHFMEWLSDLTREAGSRIQPLYGVEHEEMLTELTLDHMEGYRGSKPVRVGNAASGQLQLDVFGEAMVAFATLHRAGGYICHTMWETVQKLADAAAAHWREPDRSIWEVRGPRRHFVYSKVMCWLALDRAATMAEDLGKPADVARWRDVRDAIHSEVLERGWNGEVRSFVQHYGARHTDAALLMLPLVGFIPADDPRMLSTMKRIQEELNVGGLLRRYATERVDDGLNGGEEGVFIMCALWLAGCQIMAGETHKARALLERVIACGNHVGLFPEMLNGATGEALGNFPQAFTHVSLIHTICNLDRALSQPAGPPGAEARLGHPG